MSRSAIRFCTVKPETSAHREELDAPVEEDCLVDAEPGLPGDIEPALLGEPNCGSDADLEAGVDGRR
jgi:hypothetical protein